MNVKDKFLRYVAMDSRSDPDSNSHPTTPGQMMVAREIALELDLLGLEAIEVTENGYVYAVLPASEGCENEPTIGLIAHMDTSPDITGANVKPRTICWQGEDTALDEAGEVILSAKAYEHLNNYIGQDIIVTDGSTLLGADDKAGVAEILTAVERLLQDSSIKHGRIPLCFTPDEEVGQGADFFEVERFAADYAYTVDGGALGEIEYENFNAASADVTVHGVNIHPGEAKNKMRNAALIAMEFAAMLPTAERPEHTEGYEGFYHLAHMEGEEELARLSYIVRDHDSELFRRRKEMLGSIARYLNEKYGEGTVELQITDSYYNMKKQIEPHMHIVERAKAAMSAAGVEPKVCPIRGGTDGARLSYMGLPCPNLSTGGHNFHGRYEYIPVRSMEKMVEVLVELVRVR